ncbi:hypothetical protein [Pedobacter miscanthi]|uniref:AbiTii domain-containing protein n=1 Tax=Pedobacter miscanthi TaxID=2259170 RepID=A0A366KME8_9SPHI|nr:hypothetical protein [Pedobacter miscanthi]RBQ02871.1 hypothetical protein DRW42_24800 [Pedobacter miscanthi]
MIKDIIELLSNDEQSLSTPLLKTKVFAKRIGNASLYNWVTQELNGYDPHGQIPIYRLAKVNPYAVLTANDYSYQADQPLPLSLFNDEIIQGILKFKIDSGIKAIEEIASGKNGNTIIKPFGADFDAMLTREAQKNGAKFQISNTRVMLTTSEFTNVVGKIRSKLLDLILEVEAEYPNLEKELNDNVSKEEINKSITNIMAQINITTNGQGNVITAGNNNIVKTNINVLKGDIESFKDELKKNNVSLEDIDEIASIVISEEPTATGFGLGVNGWMSKMLTKSIDGSWEIGIATAGGILVEVLKKFYGL